MKKAIILARVSTKEQEETGLSIDKIQMLQLREYAKEYGIRVVEEFVFQETASQKLRKKFDEMIEFVKVNDEVKIILGFRIDRLILTTESMAEIFRTWDMKVFFAKQHINRCQEDTYRSRYRKVYL